MKKLTGNILLLVISVFCALLVLELAARIKDGEFTFTHYITRRLDEKVSAYPVRHDPELGWAPSPGHHGRHNKWGAKITILTNGVRSNGEEGDILPDGNQGGAILAVGDSFTFGDQVSDQETWPAFLQSLLNTRVINGGVSGYGVDQAYLRAKKLIDIYRPRILIFSIYIPDCWRCSYSRIFNAEKPYFAIEKNELVLKNVPVPSPLPAPPEIYRRVLGYSYLAHIIGLRFFRDLWLRGPSFEGDVIANDQGEEISQKIILELAELTRSRGIDFYLLLQYDAHCSHKTHKIANHLISTLPSTQIRLVDLRKSLIQLFKNDYATLMSYFDGHMSPAGNRFVALQLKDAIESAGVKIRQYPLESGHSTPAPTPKSMLYRN